MLFEYLLILVDLQDIKRETWVLTDEGKAYTATGSPEVQLFLAIPPEGIPKEELQVIIMALVFNLELLIRCMFHWFYSIMFCACSFSLFTSY